MFNFEEICELIRLVGSSKVASVEVEHAGTRVRIEGVPPAPNQLPVATAVVDRPGERALDGATAPAPIIDPQAAEDALPAEEQLHWVSSPIVGTFYRSPNPDSDPYVKVGDFVETGQTLCIVEAMKLMNEIETDATGTIVKVMPENSRPVEYGEPLFGIRRT
jgi:acetyl-CoA carboxylase biotin carboxyl carrier protein